MLKGEKGVGTGTGNDDSGTGTGTGTDWKCWSHTCEKRVVWQWWLFWQKKIGGKFGLKMA